MNINIGGLYTYKKHIALWDKPIREIIPSGQVFVILEEMNLLGYTHLKVLTTNGVVGRIEYITKEYLGEVIIE